MRFATRFVSVASANFVLLASAAAAPSLPLYARGQNGSVPYVDIEQGGVRGFLDGHGNAVYLGVPYAATTGGENRWRAPQDLQKSDVVFNATTYGATCPQAPGPAQFTELSEDCLNLNIWTPSNGSNLPVFVYMYGGAMVTGSNSNPQLQGTNFARNGVVYVNFNTRNSLFAAPHSSELECENSDESQNFNILDVEKAMEWVRENINAFGGNPDHIVFGGHSSGSVQVDHYLWNHPDTFLKGAVQMSANALSGPAFAPQDEALDAVAAEVGCPSGGQGQIDCLRNVDMSAFLTENFNSTFNTWFAPAIDDITRHSNYTARLEAGDYASHLPLLTGTSNGEGTIFSLVYAAENGNFSSWINTFDADVAHIPDSALIKAYPATNGTTEALRSGTQYGDARFVCPVDHLLNLRSSQQQTWSYRFFGEYDNVVGPPGTAPTHGTEVPFFHGGNECFDGLDGVTAEQQALADSIHGWFVDWIKDPAAGPGWESVTLESQRVAMLGVPGDRELERVLAERSEFDEVCREVYNPAFVDFPVVQSIREVLAEL
ncbi:hypothetical protein Q7P37_002043 [Cladosporium fusiforme]